MSLSFTLTLAAIIATCSSQIPSPSSCPDALSYAESSCNSLSGISVSDAAIASCCGAISATNEGYCFCAYSLESDSSVVGTDGTVLLTGTQVSQLIQVCAFDTSIFDFAGNATCLDIPSNEGPVASPEVPENSTNSPPPPTLTPSPSTPLSVATSGAKILQVDTLLIPALLTTFWRIMI